MKRVVRYRQEAFADVAEAFLWYESQGTGLGWEFIAELDATVALLEQAPEAGPVVYREFRRLLLHRFPYAIYYTLIDEAAEVRALLHQRSAPARWRSRNQARACVSNFVSLASPRDCRHGNITDRAGLHRVPL